MLGSSAAFANEAVANGEGGEAAGKADTAGKDLLLLLLADNRCMSGISSAVSAGLGLPGGLLGVPASGLADSGSITASEATGTCMNAA